jgi:pSer/pThr/pTyr-binding forkhead associated (FHA) protein
VLPDGTRQQLTEDAITIGRSSTCNVVIADTNVSRVHAQLRLVDGVWSIEDRGSTNGTRVNKETLTAAVQLVGGEEIAFGALVVRFEKA